MAVNVQVGNGNKGQYVADKFKELLDESKHFKV